MIVTAIIVAAGEGLRMRSGIRKQYLSLCGQPILAHTLNPFENCSAVQEIFLVIPEEDHVFCQEKIIAPLKTRKKVHLISGGEIRQESVYNGLKAIDSRCDLVVIHDGVRPFVRKDQIDITIATARKYGSCIVAFPASDTIKLVGTNKQVINTLEREMVWMAQTPQTFRYDLILEAHEVARREGFEGTDDASLVERLGEPVYVVPGDQYNIKITTPEDLRIAESLVQGKEKTC
nr:2-C-methyl-D-erythritol 4-phosphate cytidylyltransferase [Desulfobacterales bacterium]